MSQQLLLVSELDEDKDFAKRVAKTNQLTVHQSTDSDEVRNFLIDYPKAVVFWDASDVKKGPELGEVLCKYVSPLKVFAITDEQLSDYAHLRQFPAFSHHMLRRFREPLPELYSRLLSAALLPFPFGLLRYFPRDAVSTKLLITRSSQKHAAVDAIYKTFDNQELPPRLAQLVAKAVDELIMNAIFDAPVIANGTPYRRQLDRSLDFVLVEREQVEVEVASAGGYVGIRVADQFGSVKKDVVLDLVSRNYRLHPYAMKLRDKGAELGLYGITRAGLSLLFISKPGIRTEVIIFFEKSKNYKDFRTSFRFLSVIAL